MASVRDVGGGARLRGLFNRIREEAPRALEATGKVMAENAASRAPSIDEEYVTLMWGENNPYGFTGLPTAEGMGEDGDGRVRLFKTDEEYLANFIPQDYTVSGLHVYIGDVAGLNMVSQYMWKNIDQQTHFQSSPLWQAWENGGIFEIEPQSVRENGEPYPLAPSTDPKENEDLFAMEKAIPRKAMFSGIDIAEAVDTVLLPALKQIVRQA